MQLNDSMARAIPAAKRIGLWSILAIVAIAGIWTVLGVPSSAHHVLSRLGLWPEHRVVIFISSDDEAVLGHAIAYPMNITRSYALKNETVRIEIVANSAGIKLFRADTSPLQQQLAELRQTIPGIVFSMCNTSKENYERKEGHSIALIPGARLVPYGIGRVLDLQDAGWTYVSG
jgi:uncharacterized protein